MDTLPFRQIHLDFHTSEAIPGVGRDWSKDHFQEMLGLGHVNSITVFSKCHHGWSYHPTSVPLSQTHPTLTIDLLGAMIEAAHEIGVKTPVYISAGLDEKLVRTHTQWLRRNAEGGTGWVGWMQAGYHEFCLGTPYLDYLIAQTEEVVRGYDADGIFLDIVGPRDCVCQYCIEEIRRRGLDPRDPAARAAVGRDTYLNYARRINAAIHAIKPGLRIFHNNGHIRRGDREMADLNTHLELESLPTGGWGNDHFPLSARYVQGLGQEFLGMTGKFHTSWGEFGGYKHPNALRYEAALSLANGAKISVGDQMHPFGRLDPATYALVGEAYAEVEAKEPWCSGVTSIADVGVLAAEAVLPSVRVPGGPPSDAAAIDAGVTRVLQEGKVLFDVLDAGSDFSRYKALVLPDAIPVEGELRRKLDSYLAGGGKILATGTSGLDAATGAFALPFGVRSAGASETDPSYVVPRFDLETWQKAPFVVYGKMQRLEPDGAEPLADRQDAFFNRDYLHFCSHQHAPSTLEAAGPAIVATAKTVYVGFPAFLLYYKKGQNVLREILLHCLRRLVPEPTLETSLPAQGVQTVMRQAAEGRTIVHLLYGSPVRRGEGIEVIEDLLPVRDVQVALRADRAPKRVYLAPQNTDLPFTYDDGMLWASVPELVCHQMLVVE